MLVLLAIVAAVLVTSASRHIDFAGRLEQRLSAENLARSGLDYAAYQFSCCDWLGKDRPFEFDRKLGKGEFRLRIVDADDKTLRIESTGIDKRGSVCKLRMLMSKPNVMTDYLLCVLNYDSMNSRLMDGALCEIGSGNMAASSMTEELHTIPEGGIIASDGHSDPYYAGIVPGSTYVVDDIGIEFHLDGLRPSTSTHYSVDPRTGVFVFHELDKNKRVSIYYDYFRKVPVSPNPFVVNLPYAPLRHGSEHVWNADGTPFWISLVAPVVQANYLVDPERGAVQVSEFDSGRPIRVAYAYLGSRFTGPVHVNGDIVWHHTNRCFMFENRGDKFAASGRFRYEPGATVSLWTEKKRVQDVRSNQDAAALYKENDSVIEPPRFDLNWIRKQANPGMGGSGWYYDNSSDIECKKTGDMITVPLSDQEVLHDWQEKHSSYWVNSVYEPPGKEIDLSQLPPDEPHNGLIFAEGNLIVHGKVPPGRRLTLVSANNIYIDGSIWQKNRGSSIALLAEKNICMNLSKMDSLAASQGPQRELYINALLCARNGTLGVIPGLHDYAAIVYGALSINTLYSHDEWGKAFSSIDFVFDPAFKSSNTRPPYLSTVLRIEGKR